MALIACRKLNAMGSFIKKNVTNCCWNRLDYGQIYGISLVYHGLAMLDGGCGQICRMCVIFNEKEKKTVYIVP